MIKFLFLTLLITPLISLSQDAVIPKPFCDDIEANTRRITVYGNNYSFVLCEINSEINLKRISLRRTTDHLTMSSDLAELKIARNYEIGIYDKLGTLLFAAKGLSAVTPQQEGPGGGTHVCTISLSNIIKLEAGEYYISLRTLNAGSHWIDGTQLHDPFNATSGHKLSYITYTSKTSSFPATLPKSLEEAINMSSSENKWGSSTRYFMPKLRLEE